MYELKPKRVGNHRTHGMTGSKIYRTWAHIKGRCYKETDKQYKDYGARGITMCTEWKNSFTVFYDYVSKLPNFNVHGYSLDRINNNGNYEPNNVRWADSKTQNNNKRNVHLILYNGKSQTLLEWASDLDVDYKFLWQRLYKLNMSVEEAFSLKRYERRKKGV